EPRHIAAVCLHADGTDCGADAIAHIVIAGGLGYHLNHVADVISVPSSAREHAAEHQGTLMPRALPRIARHENARDGELDDRALEIIPGDARRLTIALPLYRLAGFVHRGWNDGCGCFPIAADAKLNDDLSGVPVCELPKLDRCTFLAVAEVTQ